MRRVWLSSLTSLTAFLVVFLARTGFGQDQFSLSFDGPTTVSGNAGQVVTQTYDVVLTHTGGDPAGNGPKGYSISMTADGPAEITDITLDGSGVDEEFDCFDDDTPDGPLCFDPVEGDIDVPDFPEVAVTPDEPLNEPTDDCVGKKGATAAVVLAFQDPVTLPVNATTVVAVITVAFTIPDGGGTATIRIADGCVGGGQPVRNVITLGTGSADPAKGTLDITLIQVVDNCTTPFNLGFSTEPLGAVQEVVDPGRGEASFIALPEPAYASIGGVVRNPDGTFGEGELCEAAADVNVEGRPGTPEKESGVVYVNIIQQTANPENVIQGWTLSIPMETSDPEVVRLVEASTDGTVGLEMQDSGFDATDIVEETVEDPDNPGTMIEQGQGATSAVVLAFQRANSLADGTVSVLALTVEGQVNEPPDGGSGAQENGADATFRFVDGLIGGGQPVPNVFTVANVGSVGLVPDQAGDPFIGNGSTAAAAVRFIPSTEARFLRGNANDDRKVNIADAIFILNFLFPVRVEPDPPPVLVCSDAADANDDGRVDIVDALTIIAWNFQVVFDEVEMPPATLPAPFSAAFDVCDVDPTEDELDCEQTGQFCP